MEHKRILVSMTNIYLQIEPVPLLSLRKQQICDLALLANAQYLKIIRYTPFCTKASKEQSTATLHAKIFKILCHPGPIDGLFNASILEVAAVRAAVVTGAARIRSYRTNGTSALRLIPSGTVDASRNVLALTIVGGGGRRGNDDGNLLRIGIGDIVGNDGHWLLLLLLSSHLVLPARTLRQDSRDKGNKKRNVCEQ